MRRLVVLSALLAPGALLAQHTTRKPTPAQTAGIAPAPVSIDSSARARAHEQPRRPCGSGRREEPHETPRPLVGVRQPKAVQPTAGVAAAPAPSDTSRSRRDPCQKKDGHG